MSFASLVHHRSIGWDFDGTLFVDHHGKPHPNMVAMHKFILANPQIKHYIVTFRTHGWQNRVFHDLAAFKSAPPPSAFEGVLNCPDETWEGAQRAKRIPGSLITDIESYLDWKGEICAEHGITVLIDDLPDMVQSGCIKHGIVYLHPDDL